MYIYPSIYIYIYIYIHPCIYIHAQNFLALIYKYTICFTLKLATLHMWKIKRKDDGMNQRTLH